MATGATMRAAIVAVVQQHPLRTIVAVPVAPEETCEAIRPMADKIVCLYTPASFSGVGEFYENFDQTSDKEVIKLLEEARRWGKGHVSSTEEHKRFHAG